MSRPSFSPVRRSRRRCAVLALVGVLAATPLEAADIDVDIDGVSGELEQNVRGFLSIERFRNVADLSTTNVRSMHRRAPREIRNALAPFGYYEAQIDASLERNGDGWRAVYRIDPGEPVRFGKLDLRVAGPGADDPAFRTVLDRPGLVGGEIARHARYEATKRRLRQAAWENGYRDAAFSASTLAVDPARRTADVTLVLDTGERYRFGEIRFDQDIIAERLIRRYPRFAPGDPFSARKLLDLEYALNDSEYFSFVEVRTGDPVEYTVPVVVTAEPRKRQKYRAALGYGTDTGPRVGLSWQNRRVNRRGHRLAMSTTLSQTKQELSSRYIVPLADPARERLSFSLALTAEELGDTDSEKFETSARQVRHLGRWQRDLYVRALRERTTIAATDEFSTLIVPGVTIKRARRDDPLLPRRGTLIEADLHGSHQAIGSSTSFVVLKLDARSIRPVGRHRLLLRGTLGTTAVDELSELPASERFFAGGDRSVRGFALNSLGPTDADGNTVGGKHVATGSVEFEWLVNDRWALAIFTDAGNALDDFGDPLEASVGIGIRRNTAIGQIRFDLAKPVTEGGESPRIHFNFGPEF